MSPSSANPLELTGNPSKDTVLVGDRGKIRWAAYLISCAVLAISLLITAPRYANAPDPMPVHWNIFGQADRFEEKNILSFLSMQLIGFAMILLLLGAAYFAIKAPLNLLKGYRPGKAIWRIRASLHSTQSFLGCMSIGISAMFAMISASTSSVTSAGTSLSMQLWAPIAVLLVSIAFGFALMARTYRKYNALAN